MRRPCCLAAPLVCGLLLVAAAAPAVGAERVGEMKAFYREGQVFLTWRELAEAKGERYAIYRTSRPIRAGALDGAERLAVVGEGSGVFAREKRIKQLAGKTKVPGFGDRFILHDNPTNDPKAMLPEGVGLFVYTCKKAGPGYWAVVPVIGGKPVPARMAALREPIAERVELPGAVLVWKSPTGVGAVYTHWMDGATWDPFREGNAYNFAVAAPAGYDGKTPLPVMFYGHGMGGSYSVMDKASYWNCLWVRTCDKSGTWFFGMMNRDKTRVVNYTELRVRWMYEWLKAGRANQFWRIDPKRVQAHGSSMGGTMAYAFALRMGDIFCSTVGAVGATIHRRNRTWVNQAARLWGPVDKNLPSVDGMGAWDYQDYAKWSLTHMDRESAFLLFNNGKRDGSVVFEPVPDFLDALQKSKRPFAARWDMRGHSWAAYGVRNEQMGAYRIPFDESVPAFANASNNDDPRTDPSGNINGRLEWSAGGNDFDPRRTGDDIVDRRGMWAMNIRSLSGPATVDVTPRRLQRFRPTPGARYAWENWDHADPANPKKIASGVVAADRYGLVTVEKFQVGKAGWGNRLVIRPAK
jgi:hypothetical protein